MMIPIARGRDNVLEDTEPVRLSEPVRRKLPLYERLGRLGQILLNLTDADRPHPFAAVPRLG